MSPACRSLGAILISSSTARASAPVGTSVKVTDLFKTFPVRRQAALKHSAKWLAKIRRLLQAYALARPSVRFSLRVQQAKSSKSNFVYAPKRESTVEDAILKVIGKDCALQCDWTAIEADGYEIRAFLPMPSAIGAKVANEGAFISVDARPVSTSRGTLNQIVVAFKERLRKANSALGSLRNPFFCINLICPPGSYDPNIEPAKDDVLFENPSSVVAAVHKLLRSYYPETPATMEQADEEMEIATSAQKPTTLGSEEPSGPLAMSNITHENKARHEPQDEPSHSSQERLIWRSDMYGTDEEDIQRPQENPPPITEEEESRHSADVSNPWTIARMNASLNRRKPTKNSQMTTPAKSPANFSVDVSSPATTITPLRQVQVETLTPLSSPTWRAQQSPLEVTPDRRIQRRSGPCSKPYQEQRRSQETPADSLRSSFRMQRLSAPTSVGQNIGIDEQTFSSPNVRKAAGLTLDMIPSSRGPGRSQRKQNFRTDNKEFDDKWFGRPMLGRDSTKISRRRKRRATQKPETLTVSSIIPPGPWSSLSSERNTDIRKFFSPCGPHARRRASFDSPRPISSSLSGCQERVLRPLSQQDPTPALISRDRPTTHPPKHATGRSGHSNDESLEQLNIMEQICNHAIQIDPNVRGSRPEFPEFLPHITGNSGSPRGKLHDERGEPTSRRAYFEVGGDAFLRESLISPFVANDRVIRASASPSPKDYNVITQLGASDATRRPTHGFANMSAQSAGRSVGLMRRRTTDGSNCTRSSKLPLERVPRGYRIQNIICHLAVDAKAVLQSMCKLDMFRNSLGWGYPAMEEPYNSFSTPVTDTTLTFWASSVVMILDRLFEPEDDADISHVIRTYTREALRNKHVQDEANLVNDEHDENCDTDVNVDADGVQYIQQWADKVEATNPEGTEGMSTMTQGTDGEALGEVSDDLGEDISDEEMLMNF